MNGALTNNMKLKVRVIAKSLGVVLPERVLRRLNVRKGDYVSVIEAPGGYLLFAHDSELENQVRIGRQIMRRYREVLSVLAKH